MKLDTLIKFTEKDFNMKKIILILILLSTTMISCVQPVLNKNQYTIIDTLEVNKSNFELIISYDVIVKFEDNFYIGCLYHSELTEINLINKIDTLKLK